MIAIDLGSNTIRFIEFDGKTWGKSFEKIVRTAEGLHETGRIGDQAVRRIIDAIGEAKTKLDFAGKAVVGCTTAAMRRGSNASEALERIREATGVAFRVIKPEDEAALTLKAVRYRLGRMGIEPESFVLADIGGGSTELITCGGDGSRAVSLEIGIVTLSESAGSAEALQERIAHFREEVRHTLHNVPGALLVLTAGTPTTIAAYLNGMDYESYDPSRINGYRLRLEECTRVYDELMRMEEGARTRFVGVGREHLIMAGIQMVGAIYEAMGREEAIIVDDSLREGIALAYFEGDLP